MLNPPRSSGGSLMIGKGGRVGWSLLALLVGGSLRAEEPPIPTIPMVPTFAAQPAVPVAPPTPPAVPAAPVTPPPAAPKVPATPETAATPPNDIAPPSKPAVLTVSPAAMAPRPDVVTQPADPFVVPLTPVEADPYFNAQPEKKLFTGFPNSLLWEPQLASHRDPKFAYMRTSLENELTARTGETFIGNTFGLLRIEPRNYPITWQVDAFGMVASRYSQSNYLVAADYRAGVPVTFRYQTITGKFGWEHTSTHYGDETSDRTGRRRIEFEKDELVFALSNVYRNWIRIYGLAAWAFWQDVPGNNPSPYRFDLGFELFNRGDSPRYGQPFAAFNIEFNGTTNYEPNVTIQGGWMWRKPEQRLSQFRVFAEYYTGSSIYGQLVQTRESFGSLGVSLDY